MSLVDFKMLYRIFSRAFSVKKYISSATLSRILTLNFDCILFHFANIVYPNKETYIC
jgi:hypothetical protein